MKNEKGISKVLVIVLLVLLAIGVIYWAKYYAQPMATVMTGGAEQAKPAIQSANRASDAMSNMTHVTEDVSKKANEEPAPEK